MAKDISSNPGSLRSRAKDFTTAEGDIGDVISDMDRLIENLESEWKGAASEGFATQYARLKPSFTEMKDLVGDISDQLRDSADAIEELDNTISSKFK